MTRIGYACLAVGVPDTGIRGVTLKNAGAERLAELIAHNLRSLEQILKYNAGQGIRLFRISSDLIPFGSSPVNRLPWPELFREDLQRLGQLIAREGMRISMHPGQYTVLNSPSADVARRAAEDLLYHALVLDSLAGPDKRHRIVLHAGGAYGDKAAALERFAERFAGLPEAVQSRLVLENDDVSYTAAEVLALAGRLEVPAVYDNLHNALNPSDPPRGDLDWIDAFAGTWTAADGPQKIHYSQQAPGGRAGSHSAAIAIDEFLRFHEGLGGRQIDLMLEVKDKNLSAVKCILCAGGGRNIGALEREWARYKYSVLEKDPRAYRQIRALLKDKGGFPAVEFYRLVESALAREATPGNSVNAFLHLWGYFKDKASDREKQSFLDHLEGFKAGGLPAAALRRELFRLAERYGEGYLLDSLYFVLPGLYGAS